MVKYDLREQGFSVVEKTPKQSIITIIWVGLALLMMGVTFISAYLFESADNIFINFFVDAADKICDDIFKSDSAVMTIYLIIWLCLGLALYLFIQSLRKNKKSALLRVILIILSIAALFGFMLTIGKGISTLRSKDLQPADYGFDVMADSNDIIGLMVLIMIVFIFMFALYLSIKLILTIWISSDRFNSVKLKVLGRGMPVCSCKEALKTWQTVLIYIVPFVFVYSLIYAQNLPSNNQLTVIIFMMTFFMAFDLTAVIYTLYYKNKEKFDYISLDHHIYSVTFFKQAYIRRSDKTLMPSVEDKQKKEIFSHITTCLNPECENYGLELEKRPKLCQSCGNRKYAADILANVVTCLNPECENYGHELKQEIERCSLCYEKTGKLAFKFKPALRIPTIVLSVLFAYIFGSLYWYESGGGSLGVIDLIKNAASIIILGMGFFSRSKAALIAAIISIIFTSAIIVLAGQQ